MQQSTKNKIIEIQKMLSDGITEKDIIKLKSLLENADDLLNLLNTKQEIEELHVLEVP